MPQPEKGPWLPFDLRTPRGWVALLRGAPTTLGFVVVFWALGAFSSSLSGPSAALQPHVAASVHSLAGPWWAVLASAFWERELTGYVLGTLLVLLVGLPLERRLGSLKLAAAALAAQVLGVGAALGFLAAAQGLMGNWTRDMGGHFFMGPSAMACGAAMAATAAIPTLWRRRVRVVIIATLMLFALFAGGLEDLVRLGAAFAGALLGPLLLGRRPRLGRPAVSRHEARVLVALLVAVAAIGPVVAGLAPHAVGPLSVLRFLFTNIQPVDPQTLAVLCSGPAQVKECAAAQLQLRAGAGGIFMSILPSFLLLLLADGLRRGRRFAWAAVLLIQATLSVLAGFTVARVLLPDVPETAAGEGIRAAGTSGGLHPLSLVLPMLVPVLPRRPPAGGPEAFLSVRPARNVPPAGPPPICHRGPPWRGLRRRWPGFGVRLYARPRAGRTGQGRPGPVPAAGLPGGPVPRDLSPEHRGRAALRRRGRGVLGGGRGPAAADFPPPGARSAQCGRGPRPGHSQGARWRLAVLADHLGRQQLLVLRRRQLRRLPGDCRGGLGARCPGGSPA